MRQTVKKVLKLGLLICSTVVLLSCSADAPVRTAKYAVQGLNSAALSNNGSTALVGSIQHGGSYWKNGVNERSFNWNHAIRGYTSLTSVDIDPSSAYAVTGSERTLVLWNTLTGEPDGYWTTPADIQSLRLTQNGDYALIGLDDQTARFFDVKNGGIKLTLRTDSKVGVVDVLPDATLGLTGDNTNNVILWDLKTGKQKFRWTLSNQISSVALSEDGKYAFGAAAHGTAKIWSTRTGEELTLIDTGSLKYRQVTISQAVFSKDNRSILVGAANSRVSLVQMSTGIIQKEWDLYVERNRPSGASVMALAFGAAERYYAIGSNGYLNVLE
jgi:WD40 repeat protein